MSTKSAWNGKVFINGWLLISPVSCKVMVGVRPFLSAMTINITSYIKTRWRSFESGIFILHVGTNDPPLGIKAKKYIIWNTRFRQITLSGNNAIVVSKKDLKKIKKNTEDLGGLWKANDIELISHKNTNSKRFTNWGTLQFKRCFSAFLSNFKEFLTNFNESWLQIKCNLVICSAPLL